MFFFYVKIHILCVLCHHCSAFQSQTKAICLAYQARTTSGNIRNKNQLLWIWKAYNHYPKQRKIELTKKMRNLPTHGDETMSSSIIFFFFFFFFSICQWWERVNTVAEKRGFLNWFVYCLSVQQIVILSWRIICEKI